MKLLRKIVLFITIFCASILFLLSTAVFWPEPLFWLGNIIAFAPLNFIAIPIIILIAISISIRYFKIVLIQLCILIYLIVFILGYNIPWQSFLPKSQQGGTLRVMTLNIGQGFESKLLEKFLRETQPDIIVFQDVVYHYQTILRNMVTLKKHSLVFDNDLAIASIYPAFKAKTIDRRMIKAAGNIATTCKVMYPAGPFILLNVHVDSPRAALISLIHNKFGGIKDMLRKTKRMKSEAMAIYATAKSFDEPILIAGDFNLTVNNPIFYKYLSQWKDSFSISGWGFGHTFFKDWYGIRIDHVLADKRWSAVNAFVGPDLGAEHRPLVADLIYKGVVTSKADTGQETWSDKFPLKKDTDQTLLMMNFQDTLENFVLSNPLNLQIDPINTHKFGNSLRLQIPPDAIMAEAVYPINWYLSIYPTLSFSYNVPFGVPFDIQGQTPFGDWITIAHSPSGGKEGVISPQKVILSDDGTWRETKINILEVVQARLASIKQLVAIRIVIPNNRNTENMIWIDDLRITK